MRSQERNTREKFVGAVMALTLVAAACGSDSDTETPGTDAPVETEAPVDTEASVETEAPVETDAPSATEAPASTDGEDTESAGIPERVVSLSPTHTEIMFAIGAGDLLVAVDDFSNFPAEALELPNELSGFEPNIEAIAGFEPDLVLASGDGAQAQLEDLGIAVWVGPAASSIDDTYAQIEQLGAATGRIAEAAELVSSMQTRIDAVVAEAPTSETPLTYYHELDPTLFSTTSDTFIGEVYSLLGLVNIADEGADGNQFPQLNAEAIIEANPDLIFLADTKCCAETAETVAARDGWDAIAAVQNGNVIEMDDDIASRWGPRIVDYLEAVSAAVNQVAVSV